MSKIELGNLLDWQHEYIHSEAYLKVLCGASNTGKSHIARVDDLLHCITNPGAHVCVTAETYTQAVRAVIEPMVTQMIDWGLGNFAEWRKGDGIYEFVNGSRIEVYSSEKIFNRIRSRQFSRLHIEEATTIDDKYIEEIFYAAIRYLRQPGFDTSFCLTMNPDVKSRYLHERLYDNPDRNMFKEDINFYRGYHRDDKEYEDRLKMGSKRQQNLYLWGLWGNLAGQAFVLEEGRHIREFDCEEEGLDQFYIGFDYGFYRETNPPMIYLLAAIKNGIIFYVDEICLNNVDVSNHAKYLAKWSPKFLDYYPEDHRDEIREEWEVGDYNIVGYTGDTATGSKEIRTVVDTIKVLWYPPNKTRAGWTTLHDSFETDKAVIHTRCKHLIKSLGTMLWIPATKGADCEGTFDDPADTARYIRMCPWIRHKHLGGE